MRVTFFGHRQASEALKGILMATIENLIINNHADTFYVGHQGEFDAMVRRVLKQLQEKYPHISYAVVLAYMPTADRAVFSENVPTLYPSGLETVPPKFAINHRNDWMIEHSDIIISYVTRSVGGAATFTKKAEKKGKRVIRLSL